jgi:hypothetical protein
MAVSTKMAVVWVVAPCSLVEFYQRFRGPSCLHYQGNDLLIALMMEAARTSETLLNFYQTTRSHNPKDSHLHPTRQSSSRMWLISPIKTHFELEF